MAAISARPFSVNFMFGASLISMGHSLLRAG
nr:MAG TPA: Metallothionein family 11 [Caudoviricetes sp.]